MIRFHFFFVATCVWLCINKYFYDALRPECRTFQNLILVHEQRHIRIKEKTASHYRVQHMPNCAQLLPNFFLNFYIFVNSQYNLRAFRKIQIDSFHNFVVLYRYIWIFMKFKKKMKNLGKSKIDFCFNFLSIFILFKLFQAINLILNVKKKIIYKNIKS